MIDTIMITASASSIADESTSGGGLLLAVNAVGQADFRVAASTVLPDGRVLLTLTREGDSPANRDRVLAETADLVRPLGVAIHR